MSETAYQNHIESYYDGVAPGSRLGRDAGLFGRMEILTGVDEITENNLMMVLSESKAIHDFNARQIEYLYMYTRGLQPVLHRKKTVRPEINNHVVENHAAEVAQFTSAYFLGEPLTYVRRGDRIEASEGVSKLNDYMYFADKATRDMELATWMAICGVGYRMILPSRGDDEESAPFEIDTCDPRFTFVVYNSGFGHRRMMAVRMVWKQDNDGAFRILYCGYTRSHYFEVLDGTTLVTWKPHSLGDIPIFEYRLNMTLMGSFEPAIPLLDAINLIQSNRVDGVEQFVQSFLKFKNCEVETGTIEDLRKMGAIQIKSVNGLDSDVQIISQELNQQQVQTLIDYLYDQVLVICGMPTTTKGGSSTSDTGQAVFLRDGWSQCEARAKDTEGLFKRSERQFLKLALKIARETRDLDLALREVDCKFSRQQRDNLLTKTQALIHMLQAGLAPDVAIATCGLFNDPADIATQSAGYLKKWDFVELSPDASALDEMMDTTSGVNNDQKPPVQTEQVDENDGR